MNYEELSDRELDALVAERVMGYREKDVDAHKAIQRNERGETQRLDPVTLCFWLAWRPSACLSDAFEVLAVMQKRGLRVEIVDTPNQHWGVCFLDSDVQSYCDVSTSLPHSICIAALRALDA